MTLLEACKKAYDWFLEERQYSGLSTISESETKWFFSAGQNNRQRIGILIISITKDTGHLAIVDMFDDETYIELKNSRQLAVPSEFAN